MFHLLQHRIGIKHWAMLPAFFIALVLPFVADAQVFGQIPNLLDRTASSAPRSGTWSIRPFMRLGNGYRSAGTGAPGIPRTPRTPTTVGIFGPIPLDLTRGQGFGEIPDLLSWRDR